MKAFSQNTGLTRSAEKQPTLKERVYKYEYIRTPQFPVRKFDFHKTKLTETDLSEISPATGLIVLWLVGPLLGNDREISN
jgi:hypothetical protein